MLIGNGIVSGLSTFLWLNEFLGGESFIPFSTQIIYSYFAFACILSFYSLWTCRHDFPPTQIQQQKSQLQQQKSQPQSQQQSQQQSKKNL